MAATELLGLVSRILADPSSNELVAGTCEYVMMRYPNQPGAAAQCKAFLKVVDVMRKGDAKAGREAFLASLSGDLDFEVAVRDNLQRIRDLLALCAKKARETPPPATPPVSPVY